MLIKEYGYHDRPAVLIAQPEPPEDCRWVPRIGRLAQRYRLLFPAPDCPAREIAAYIAENGPRDLHAVCGFSDRWDVIQALLSEHSLRIQKVIYEDDQVDPGELVCSILL